jgi:hypothetical protein
MRLQIDSSEAVSRYFDVNPTSVLGLLVGGLVLVVVYLVFENRSLKERNEELTNKLIELTTTLIERLSDIKSGIEIHSNNVVSKVDSLILWIKSNLRKKE